MACPEAMRFRYFLGLSDRSSDGALWALAEREYPRVFDTPTVRSVGGKRVLRLILPSKSSQI
jgi:hypothetical protein